MAARIEVTGLRELNRNLRAVDRELPKETARIHRAVVEPVAERAAARVRSRSGRLAASVRGYGTQRAAQIGAGARLKYAGVNHYGWPGHNIEGNPFLTDALTESRLQVVADYERMLGVFIERVWLDSY